MSPKAHILIPALASPFPGPLLPYLALGPLATPSYKSGSSLPLAKTQGTPAVPQTIQVTDLTDLQVTRLEVGPDKAEVIQHSNQQ